MTFTEPGHCVKRKVPQDDVCPRNQTVYGPQVKTLKDWKPEFPGLNPVTKKMKRKEQFDAMNCC